MECRLAYAAIPEKGIVQPLANPAGRANARASRVGRPPASGKRRDSLMLVASGPPPSRSIKRRSTTQGRSSTVARPRGSPRHLLKRKLLPTQEDTFMGSKTVTLGASLPLVIIVMTVVGPVIVAGQTPPATAVSGSDLFYNSCASCHGRDGKGNGPLGQVLTVRPADLTILAKKTGGTFPAAKIYELIDGRNPAVRGHGGPDMPVWGDAFAKSREAGDAERVKKVIQSLVDYLESIQLRPANNQQQ